MPNPVVVVLPSPAGVGLIAVTGSVAIFASLQRVDELLTNFRFVVAIGQQMFSWNAQFFTNLLDWFLIASRAISISDLWLIGDSLLHGCGFSRVGILSPFSDATCISDIFEQTAARWHSWVSDEKRIDGTIGFVLTRPLIGNMKSQLITDTQLASRSTQAVTPRRAHAAALNPLPHWGDPP